MTFQTMGAKDYYTVQYILLYYYYSVPRKKMKWETRERYSASTTKKKTQGPSHANARMWLSKKKRKKKKKKKKKKNRKSRYWLLTQIE